MPAETRVHGAFHETLARELVIWFTNTQHHENRP